MALYLYSIDEAEDRKFIVTKAMSGQAKMGTLVHIMECSENSSGISVSYRVTETGQDFNIKFLPTNYRSTQNIVNASNSVIKNNKLEDV